MGELALGVGMDVVPVARARVASIDYSPLLVV